jgi:acetyl-CoA carboxylase biotin carboxyl carrier protein
MAEKKPGIDQKLIRDLAALLKETDLSEIEVEQNAIRIRVSRATSTTHVAYAEPARTTPAMAAPPTAGEAEEARKSLADPARHPGSVPSPMVGTAYRSAEPNGKPFVEVGDEVRVGQAILIVEAMKHMNEVAAPRPGKVVAILVEDGQPVEYGQPLMIIE